MYDSGVEAMGIKECVIRGDFKVLVRCRNKAGLTENSRTYSGY